jgi:hypothetical protein
MPQCLDGLRLGAAALLLAVVGCVSGPPIAVSAGPIPPGQARIWFYRIYDPSLSLNLANVDLNGTRLVTVPPHGPALYRDVAPGHYHISPESSGTTIHQSRDVDLAAGQEVFVKILDDPTWTETGDTTDIRRDTFFVWLMPAQLAKAEMAMPM